MPGKRGRPRTRKASTSKCAPGLSYNQCQAKMTDCVYVHGKREYCRSRKNKRKSA